MNGTTLVPWFALNGGHPVSVAGGRGQPAPWVRSPARGELLARLQRADGHQPVTAPERLPGGVGEGEVALDDVDDAEVGVPPDGDGPELVLAAERRGRAAGGRLDHVGERVADRHELGHALQQAVERLAPG